MALESVSAQKKSGRQAEEKADDLKLCGATRRIDTLDTVHEIICSAEDHSSVTLEPEAIEAIRHMARDLGFEGMRVVRTREVVTARWVSLKCRYGCQNYNTCWCCPPASPDLQATRELLSEYCLALVLRGSNRNEHFYRNSLQKRRNQIKQWKATISLERKLFLMGYYKAFGLPAETCALCKKCAYPGPCKFPSEKRPSVEACSIDLFQTVRKLGRPVTLAGGHEETYNSYSLILLI